MFDDDLSNDPKAWRNDDAHAIAGSATGALDNASQGWLELSSSTNGDSGFAVNKFCQNGQCGYDEFVAHPPGGSPDDVWYGGSMNYDELPAYDTLGKSACAAVRPASRRAPTAGPWSARPTLERATPRPPRRRSSGAT